MNKIFNSILLSAFLIYICDGFIVKRRPEMDTNGFYGDTFSSGFGDFYTAKRNDPRMLSSMGLGWQPQMVKRRPEMDTNGFYGDTFSSGFGDFYTAKRSKENF